MLDTNTPESGMSFNVNDNAMQFIIKTPKCPYKLFLVVSQGSNRFSTDKMGGKCVKGRMRKDFRQTVNRVLNFASLSALCDELNLGPTADFGKRK